MKKLVYLFALLLIPALAISQKSGKELTSVPEGYTEVEWTFMTNQIGNVEKEIDACKQQANNCKKLNTYARSISKQSQNEQIVSILSSGAVANFLGEMASLEKAMLKSKGNEKLGPKHVHAAYKKTPGYTLSAVNQRIIFYKKRMESVDDDE